MRIIDSHLHLWDPELLDYPWLSGALAWRFADTELEYSRVEAATSEQSVFVQAGSVPEHFLEEVRWVASMAERLGIVGIVAGARLDQGTDTTAHLEDLDDEPLVVGVRHLLQDERDGMAGSPAFVTGAREVAARGWSFDACVRAEQLPEIARLVGAIPDLRVVLDHLGKPAVGTAEQPAAPTAEWARDLAELARHPEAFCKLSGLPAESQGSWSASQLVPFLDVATDAFGPDRVMWGSDWPVSAIGPAESGDPHAPADGSPTYQPTARSRWADTVMVWAKARDHDVDAIMRGNAERFYRTDQTAAVADEPRRGFLDRILGRGK